MSAELILTPDNFPNLITIKDLLQSIQMLPVLRNRGGEWGRGKQRQFDYHSGRALQAARSIRYTAFCCCWRIDLLWAEFC